MIIQFDFQAVWYSLRQQQRDMKIVWISTVRPTTSRVQPVTHSQLVFEAGICKNCGIW